MVKIGEMSRKTLKGYQVAACIMAVIGLALSILSGWWPFLLASIANIIYAGYFQYKIERTYDEDSQGN